MGWRAQSGWRSARFWGYAFSKVFDVGVLVFDGMMLMGCGVLYVNMMDVKSPFIQTS